MADVVDAATRSRMMAGIRGKNTQPELAVRTSLHRLGLRFRLHVRSLPGNPDLVLARHRTVVFVHGCFWHAHHCGAFHLPTSRAKFWTAKLAGNVNRDKRKVRDLRALGWRVLVIWECAVRSAIRQDSIEPFELAGDWLINYDAPYLEITCGRRNGFSKRKSTARAL